MKPSVAAILIQSSKQNSKKPGFAESAARKLFGIFAIITVMFMAGCGSSSTISMNDTNGPATTVPSISLQPANMTVTAGSTSTFSAAATGTPTPSVQWQVSTNGGTSFTAVAGAASTTFSFIAMASQNGNIYEATFTNSVSSVTSTAATLTVNSAPMITTNPANVNILAGSNATFTAAATGTPMPTVQWQISTNGGTAFSNLAGATSPTLTFTAVAAMNGNQYKTVFTNSVSSATTTTAILTANVMPAVSINPTNVSAAAGNLATFTADATGQPTPTVQWMVSTNGGTAFSPVVGANSTSFSLTTTAGMDGNFYEAVFTNVAGSSTSTTATLTVNSDPTVTTNPAPLTIGDGGTAIFTAAATGKPTPTAQWFVSTNGGASFNAIVGATSPTLSFAASLAQSQNLYQAVFTNSAGASTTAPALLTVTVILTVVVAITNPSTSPITLGTGGIINFSAALTNGAAGIGVNWSVNGVAGGNSTLGTITNSTQAGSLATYSAPATAPGTGVLIVATYAGAGNAASEPVTVNVVANHNATLTGQFAFQMRGFQISGLPFGMIGTFTADGFGGLSNTFIDTNAVESVGGGSAFTSKVAWNGSYSMDTTTHGIMHLTLPSDSTAQMNFAFTFNNGNGSIAEIDTPLASTASGTFSAASSSSFTLAAGGLNGAYIIRLDGPETGDDGYFGLLGQMTFAPMGSSTTAGTVDGSFTLNDGSMVNIVGGAVAMDADGSGHASVVLPLDDFGDNLTLSVYVSTSGRIFTLDSDSTSAALTGVFRTQTIPVEGFTAANVFTSAMLFEAIGVDPSNNHASVIVGSFSPAACNPTTQVSIEYDENDGGAVPAAAPVQLTGTFTVDSTVPGFGTLAFSNGLSFVFYMRSPGQGFILEVTPVNSASRVGEIGPQTEPSGGFVSATLSGTTQNVGTVTTTPASASDIAIVAFGSGTYTASADGSALAQPPFITGSSTGTVAITDPVRGRGTATPVTGSIFGAAHTVFYTIDSSGAFIMISVDPTTLEPQIIIVGN